MDSIKDFEVIENKYFNTAKQLKKELFKHNKFQNFKFKNCTFKFINFGDYLISHNYFVGCEFIACRYNKYFFQQNSVMPEVSIK